MKQTEQTAVRLERDFFLTDGITLAKKLLGKIMVHETADGPIRAVITETEAYMGAIDKGSHAYGGRRTNRTETMFNIGGTSYVYLIYGMYFCMNVVANEAEIPQAGNMWRTSRSAWRSTSPPRGLTGSCSPAQRGFSTGYLRCCLRWPGFFI